MKKVILIDGNNILFRSYFATAYKGTILRNSKGFPTNALYGFINMINKILKEENPSYIMVAFDKGKTFRHEKYKDYKAGRDATPEDLKLQFPAAKRLCVALGIKYFEIDNYEADDIIGTFAKEIDQNDDFIATIVSSDKDLLQLISDDVTVKLLKASDYIMMDEDEFKNTYGIEPIKMIDLKALMGDASDNIPGVKGVGEKTALTLLKKYKSLEGVYEHLPEIKGALKEKLVNDKENAFFSKELATIYKDVPIDVNLENIKYNGLSPDYNKILEDLEFYSFLKREEKQNVLKVKVENIKIIKNKEVDLEQLKNEKDFNKVRNTLLTLPGVGPKVADCILLFSTLKRWEAFPIDVWVRRVMNELYIKNPDETKVKKEEIEKIAYEKFGNLAGIAQQYLFYWKREA